VGGRERKRRKKRDRTVRGEGREERGKEGMRKRRGGTEWKGKWLTSVQCRVDFFENLCTRARYRT